MLNIGMHLRHLRRLWGLPTRGDRLEESLTQIPEDLTRVEAHVSQQVADISRQLSFFGNRLEAIVQQVAADSLSADDVTTLLLRRLGRLDESNVEITGVVEEIRQVNQSILQGIDESDNHMLGGFTGMEDGLNRIPQLVLASTSAMWDEAAVRLRDLLTERDRALQDSIDRRLTESAESIRLLLDPDRVHEPRVSVPSSVSSDLMERNGSGWLLGTNPVNGGAIADEARQLASARSYADGMTPEVADFLNWAGSHRGLRAQFNLWINDPVTVAYGHDEVLWANTNERIVEIPFALQALARLPMGSHILDVGACESLLALQLASLGYRVSALDIRDYPFTHDRLRRIRGSIVDWAGDGSPCDAVIFLSSLEHIGLPEYGTNKLDVDADSKALLNARKLLRPGGLLVLTAPFGLVPRTELQRTYTAEALARLLDGFRVQSCGLAARMDEKSWTVKWDVNFESLKYVDLGKDRTILIVAESGET